MSQLSADHATQIFGVGLNCDDRPVPVLVVIQNRLDCCRSDDGQLGHVIHICTGRAFQARLFKGNLALESNVN